MINLCVIIPAYNEENTIIDTVNDYKSAFPNARIIVIDNDSSDETAKKAKQILDLKKDLLITEIQKGKGFAVKAGISRLEADIYIMTDGDDTYPASDAKKLVEIMLNTRVDMLIGDRMSGGSYSSQNKRLGHNLGNKSMSFVISKLTGKKFNDVFSGLRIMSRPLVNSLDISSPGFQLETELNVLSAYLRADIQEVQISYNARKGDSSSKLNTFRDGFKILRFAFFNWLLFVPLQPFLILATLMLLLSFGLGYRIISGFLATGFNYSTTAVVASASILIAICSIFFGLSLHIIGRNNRRREIAAFLEEKRKWNTRLDETVI